MRACGQYIAAIPALALLVELKLGALVKRSFFALRIAFEAMRGCSRAGVSVTFQRDRAQLVPTAS